MYLENCPENLDKSRKEELTNSLLYLSNLSKNVQLNEEHPVKKNNSIFPDLETQKLLNNSLKMLQQNSKQSSEKNEGKDI
jgi:hypothetical protein